MKRRSFLKGMWALMGVAYVNPTALIPDTHRMICVFNEAITFDKIVIKNNTTTNAYMGLRSVEFYNGGRKWNGAPS